MSQSTTLPISDTQTVIAIPAASFISTPPGYTPGVLQAGNVPTAASDTPAVCTVASDPTGLILTLTAVAAGTANITVSGIAQNSFPISTAFQVIVTGGPATGFYFTFSPPVA